jgi:hypothetical protein
MMRPTWTRNGKQKINEGNRAYQTKIWGYDPEKRTDLASTDLLSLSPGASSVAAASGSGASPPVTPPQGASDPAAPSPDLDEVQASDPAAPSPDSLDEVRINEASTSTFEGIKRKRRQLDGQVFQVNWVGQFPWCRELVREDGEVAQVECKVCTKIDGRPKILQAKVDGLKKHQGRKKALFDLKCYRVNKGKYYWDHNSTHMKNERLCVSMGKEQIQKRIALQTDLMKKQKVPQFVTVNHMLRLGRPMSDYPAFQGLLRSLSVPSLSKVHWSDSAGYEMANCLSQVVENKTKEILAKAEFISLSADEVTSCDNQQWLSIHAYYVKDYERKSVLVSLSRLLNGSGAEAVKKQILQEILIHAGLDATSLTRRLVCMGADGAAVFQGSRMGVMVQLIEQHAPFMLQIHCVAHRTNLVSCGEIGELFSCEGSREVVPSLAQLFGQKSKAGLAV